MAVKKYSFTGGLDVLHEKHWTADKPIRNADVPDMLYIPMQQHIGAPCEPLVSVGDPVKLGQKIGEGKAFVSAPVHASVSGKVKQIIQSTTSVGVKTKFVVIENDHLDTKDENYFQRREPDALSGEELLALIKDAGITGMGGASFPTHVKLSPPKDKPIDLVLINGAECEPFLTSDYRLMLEKPENIIEGLRILMKVLNVSKGLIGVEDNKPDAFEILKEKAAAYPEIEVYLLKTKYPQGDEKRLINALTGREVPSGGLPMDVKCVVQNIATTNAVYEACVLGKPLYERVMTVTGRGIASPDNLMVRIGTLFEEVIRQCGGFSGPVGKIIAGGPMMGMAQWTIDTPTIKGSGGLLLMPEEDAQEQKPTQCIKCGKCVEVCPVHLQPIYIAAYAQNKNFEMAAKYSALDCVECGSCSYICPARRPLVESIRFAKREIIARNKKK